jgi:uncharacterized protein YbjT (DUF2867 family)
MVNIILEKTTNDSFLVLGGTGHYGRHIVKSLVELGESVKVVTRNPEKAKNLLGEKPIIVKGDITNENSLLQLLENCKGIIISVSGFSRKTIRQIKKIERDSVLMLLDKAKEMNISRVVFISVYDFNEELINELKIPQAKIKQDVEQYLSDSDFNWTVLGAGPSIEMFFTMIRGKTMMVPGGGPPMLPTISPIDLGKICAQAIVREDLSERRFRLTGPEALSFPVAAERISKVVGYPIKFRKIPLIPIKIASIVTRPFTPYLWYLRKFILLLNNFPQEIALEVPKDHAILRSTFDYQPITLEMHAEMWRDQNQK